LSLDVISQKAFISPFHFHRLFKLYTSETLNAFVSRLRLERAAFLLIKEDISISDISSKVGFSSNSSFTKAFKKKYTQNPSEFKKKHPSDFSMIRLANSKIGQDLKSFEDYICEMEKNKNWLLTKGEISILTQSEKYCASIFHVGDIGFQEKFGLLIQWGYKNKIITMPDFKMGTIYYDSYKTTEASKVRKSAFLLLDKPLDKEDDLITPKSLVSGKYIKASLELKVNEFSKAYSGLFIWMNEHGYSKNENPPFEIYHNNFNEHPQKLCIVDIFIPIC